MPVRHIDHLAITVSDIEATLAFYQDVIGAELVYADAWRAGKLPVAILQVGASRLSVHRAESPATPHARLPTPGAIDLCFRWDGGVADAEAHLGRCGVPVVEGPVPRPAADGELGASVYFRDPDGNLLELLSTEESP
jgi:catechol 2,3-dioxygenase-like lactoylglutathione lyase family enzyme